VFHVRLGAWSGHPGSPVPRCWGAPGLGHPPGTAPCRPPAVSSTGVEGVEGRPDNPPLQGPSKFPVPPGSDPSLDGLRTMPSGICWWCGERPATTREHKYKQTDLRRMALTDGRADPSNVYRRGESYSGVLKSIARGSAIQWSKNMCKACNGGRDRHFDAAYELFSQYVWDHQDELLKARFLRWPRIYDDGWQRRATNVARYLGKQFGCMLATQCLPVPQSLIRFLDGADACPDISFRVYRDLTKVSLHEHAKTHGDDLRGYWLPQASGLRDPEAGALTGCNFGFVIGHIGLSASWRAGHCEAGAFFRHRWTRIVNTGEYVDLDQFAAQSLKSESNPPLTT